MTTQKTKLAKFLAGMTLAATALSPLAASAQSLAELIAKYPQLAAVLAPYMAATPSMGSAMCNYTFTMGLKTGSTGQEVWNLQKMLNMWADTKVDGMGAGSSGMETMYFGPATKSAVMRFQAKYASDVLYPSGLTAPTGMVGPATRAKLNALCQTSQQSTTTNTTTTTTTTVTTPSGLQGSAGSVNATWTTSGSDTTINQGQSGKALSFYLQASGSDVSVSNVKVTLIDNDTAISASNRLERYMSKAHVWMNGTEIGSMDVSSFTRNNDNTYTASIPVSNAIIRMGAANRQQFYVSLDANTSLDSSDVVTTNNWYIGASEIRYTDATGVTFTTVSAPSVGSGASGSYGILTGTLVAKFQFQKLSSSGSVKVAIASGSNNPQAGNIMVSNSSQTRKVVLNEFNIRAQGSPITFNTVTATMTAAMPNGSANNIDAIANTFYIMHNGSQIGTLTAPSNQASPYLASVRLDQDYTVSQDTTDTFQIVADINKNSGNTVNTSTTFDQGDTIKADLQSINPTDKNGDNVTTASGNLTGTSVGNIQTFFTTGLQATGFISSIASANNGTQNIPSGQTYSLTIKLKAFGNTFYLPKTATTSTSSIFAIPSTATTTGLSLHVKRAGTDVFATPGVGIVLGSLNSTTANTVNSWFQIPDGSEQTFTTSVTLNPQTASSTGVSGQYSVQLDNIGYTTDSVNGTNIINYVLQPTQNYRTNESYVASY